MHIYAQRGLYLIIVYSSNISEYRKEIPVKYLTGMVIKSIYYLILLLIIVNYMSPPGINLHSVIYIYTLAYRRTHTLMRMYVQHTAGPQFYMLLHTISHGTDIIRTN